MTYERRGSKDRERIEERQQKEVTGESETYVMTRSVDRSVLAKSNAFFERYKIFWYLLMGFLLAVGFDFKTPRQFYDELQNQVNQQAKQLQAADIDRKEMSRKLDILITFRCLDQTGREMAIAGVECDKFVNPNLRSK